MNQLLEVLTVLLEKEDEKTSSKINEDVIKHCKYRKTLPLPPSLRKAILAIYMSKYKNEEKLKEININDITGLDLYNVVSDKTIRDNVFLNLKSQICKLTFKDLSEWSEHDFLATLENYKYSDLAEDQLIKAICVLVNWRDEKISFKEKNWQDLVIDEIMSNLADNDFKEIEEVLRLDTPLNRVAQVPRIEAYRRIIAKLTTIK